MTLRQTIAMVEAGTLTTESHRHLEHACNDIFGHTTALLNGVPGVSENEAATIAAQLTGTARRLLSMILKQDKKP